MANPWAGRPVTITSIDFVKRAEVMRALEALVWDAVVFDEAHGLTGHSDRAVAAGALARRARNVVLLTATPHSGDDQAFASLCGLGDLGQSLSAADFRRTRQRRRSRRLAPDEVAARAADTGRARDAPRSQHYARQSAQTSAALGAIRRTWP